MNNSIEFVEWIDSSFIDAEWTDLDEVKKVDCSTIDSIGFIVNETEKYIVLSSHISNDISPTVCGTMLIPKVSILHRETLYRSVNELFRINTE